MKICDVRQAYTQVRIKTVLTILASRISNMSRISINCYLKSYYLLGDCAKPPTIQSWK